MCASNQIRLLKYIISTLCVAGPQYESCEALPREDGPLRKMWLSVWCSTSMDNTTRSPVSVYCNLLDCHILLCLRHDIPVWQHYKKVNRTCKLIWTFDTKFPTIINKSCTYITFKSALKHKQLSYGYLQGQTYPPNRGNHSGYIFQYI